MPEVYLDVQWPDGARSRIYSPSSIVRDEFHAGATLTVEEFLRQSVETLHRADRKVERRFGFRCSQVVVSVAEIRRRASEFGSDDEVRILGVEGQ